MKRKSRSKDQGVTRRQLLSQGLLGLCGLTFTSSWQRALFAEGNSAKSAIPFLVFDLAGGAAMPGNFLAFNQGGDLLKNYDLLGWNPRDPGALDDTFGLPLSVHWSKMREGIYAATTPETRARFKMASIAHYSQDDNNENQTSAAGLVASLKEVRGIHLPFGVGKESTLSGGKTQGPGFDDATKATRISSLFDLVESLSFGPAFRGLDPSATGLISSLTQELTSLQLDRAGELDKKAEVSGRLDELYTKTRMYHAGIPNADPRREAVFKKIYGISESTDGTNEDVISAAIVMNVLNRAVGPSVITIPECDYHENKPDKSNVVDLRVGLEIGRALEAARQLGKPLFIQILTDGGVYAEPGTRNWKGDAGDKSMTVLGYFHPQGRVSVKQVQLGHYTEGQSVDRGTFLGGDPKRVAYATLANYLHVNDRLGEFKSMAGEEFSSQKLDSLLVFG